MIWDHSDYIIEARNRLSDKTFYNDVTFNKNIIPNPTEKSIKIFENWKRRGFITEKQLNYLRFDSKNSCSLGKLYFLPKIHKLLSNVSGRPVISTSETTTEKVSEFLDNQLQPIKRKVFH